MASSLVSYGPRDLKRFKNELKRIDNKNCATLDLVIYGRSRERPLWFCTRCVASYVLMLTLMFLDTDSDILDRLRTYNYH